MTTEEKLFELKKYIKDLGSVAVAYSAGVDSTFLLKVAHDVLGDKCIALTAVAPIFSSGDKKEGEEFCEKEGITQVFVEGDMLSREDFVSNPKDRCYHCKYRLFSKMKEIGRANDAAALLEGSNTDDMGDYRPGMKAIAELEVKSPLLKCGLSKEEIRRLSKEMGLPTAQKQSSACLASRIPYGEVITEEKVKQIDKGEQILKNLGFQYYRLRLHGELVRIEVMPEELERLATKNVRERLVTELKALGFLYVTMDLQGYRRGSLNEVL